ncbi:hypothetical protein [Stenotrophomonas maltophilia]|uniref:hypothetical protein n=1 Tax=Stenotrophomonas maltophilia TaxID=40324 RepID=UPI001E5CF193|nr:hypothetical protein [Stenotrophomonas maltophilia]
MRTRTKLGLSLVALFSSLPLMVATGNGYFILLLLIGLPAAILFWFDLGRELRAIPTPTRSERALGLAMGIPQVLFGLLCAGIGLILVAWILYNLLVQTLPVPHSLTARLRGRADDDRGRTGMGTHRVPPCQP